MTTDVTPVPELGDRLETVRMDALSEAARDGNRGVLQMHQAIANRLLREGAPARAFSELVRATREVPMNARLAAALAHIALKAGTLSAAVTLLSQGLDEVEGKERVGVRHALARLYRRSDDLELAREQLVVLLAEHPTDRRARLTLNALLEREERWDELDASLEKETREELRRGALRRASRTALKRARLWGERLDNPARAALRYGQAAQFAEQGHDFESCFLLRLLWLRALHKSQAPERAMAEALEAAMRAGTRVGKADRVRHMAAELKLSGAAPIPSETEVAVAIVTEGNEETAAQAIPLTADTADSPAHQPGRRNSTQLELMAVAAEAEKKGSKPVVAAILRAAVEESPDPQALKRLEAHYVARGAWRELATFYSDNAGKARSTAEKAQWKEKLAELLESELSDGVGAAKVWSEVVELTGDQRAVQEQVRLHSERKDPKSVRRALDEGVHRAATPQAKADALVARAEEALTRKETTAANADFQTALAAVPQHPAALAGLAELAALDGDVHVIPMLKLALEKVARRKPGRAELYRRLARLFDLTGKDPRAGRLAWAEVLFELPEDEEASSRMSVLARADGDSGQLETALRAQITKTPRGLPTREARLELVALLERTQRSDDALNELRTAVRFEPGHQQAWLALADRLEQRGIWNEAAWALEHGTTATGDGPQRMALWQRLARFVADHLGDYEKAEVYQKRADKLRRELAEEEEAMPEVTNAAPLAPAPKNAQVPSPAEATPLERDFEKLAALLDAVPEPEPTPPLPPPIPRRGGVPPAALEMLRVLATGGVVKTAPQPAFVPKTAPQPAFVPPANVPWGDVPSSPVGELKSSGRGVRVPLPSGEKPSAPLESRPELKGTGRGVPISAPGPAGRPPPSVRVQAVAPPPAPQASPGARIPAVEPRQKPAIPLKPRASAPDPDPAPQTPVTPVTVAPPTAVMQETRNLRIPLVPVPPPVNHDDDEEWEGSTVGRLDDDEDVSVEEAMSGVDDVVEVGSEDVQAPSEDWEAPPGVQSGEAPEPEVPHSTMEIPSTGAALGDPSVEVPASFGPSPSKVLTQEREALFEQVREEPLEPDGYKLLAEHFDSAGDASRSALMHEIALALEGDPNAAPRAPKLILSATDRAGLKHPVLRGEEGELLGMCGLALCRIYPTKGADAGTRDEFRLDLGKGAKAAADALLTAVRILGLRAPDVYPSNDNGPPFALVFPGAPRLLVGRLAIKRELPEAELRFFAGRALFTQNPDLLCLRNLRREQLIRSLQVLTQVLRGQSLSAEARAVRDGLPAKGLDRLKQLNEKVARKMNLATLSEGARHSANRAGLVVCGGVAPALAALRAKKALPSEMIELVRFAASERYLQLRQRKLGK